MEAIIERAEVEAKTAKVAIVITGDVDRGRFGQRGDAEGQLDAGSLDELGLIPAVRQRNGLTVSRLRAVQSFHTGRRREAAACKQDSRQRQQQPAAPPRTRVKIHVRTASPCLWHSGGRMFTARCPTHLTALIRTPPVAA